MPRLLIASVLLFVSLPERPAAADESGALSGAATLAPYLDEQVIAVGRLDVTRIDVEAILQGVADATALDESQEATLASVAALGQAALDRFLEAGVREIYTIVSLADVPQSEPFLLIPLTADADPDAVTRLFAPAGRPQPDQRPERSIERLDGVLFVGSETTLKRLREIQSSPRPELADALAAASDIAVEGGGPTSAQFVVIPSAAHRRVVREMLPMLPPSLGGGSGETISEALRWAALGVDLNGELAVQLTIQSEDARTAERLEQLLDRLLANAGAWHDLNDEFPGAAQALKRLKFQARDDRVVLTLTSGEDLDEVLRSLVLPPIEAAREAAARTETRDRLHQLGLALHRYHDRHDAFPAQAITDEAGQPLLSWRVQLLPFLGEEELFKQFRLDEPWDSEHNRALIARIPEAYQRPGLRIREDGRTSFLAPVGEETIFPPGKALPLQEVTDGLSNTILLVESGDKAVEWTKPEDIAVNLQEPFQGLAGGDDDRFQVLMGDGAVRDVSRLVLPETLRALLTRSGNEPAPQF